MDIKDPLLLGLFNENYFKIIILFITVKLFKVKAIFNEQFSWKSVVWKILVCLLCAISPLQRLTSYQQNCLQEGHGEVGYHFANTYLMKNDWFGILCNSAAYTSAVTWSISPAFPAYTKVPCLQSFLGFEGAEGVRMHRLPSSWSEPFSPQLQPSRSVWI